jgi:hypothetical protein
MRNYRLEWLVEYQGAANVSDALGLRAMLITVGLKVHASEASMRVSTLEGPLVALTAVCCHHSLLLEAEDHHSCQVPGHWWLSSEMLSLQSDFLKP